MTVEPNNAGTAGRNASEAAIGAGVDFLRTIVAEDLRAGRHDHIVTRFPPEPNGYLHIGHAASIVLNFGIATETGGRCHLRFDDTNPETEDIRYVESIMDSIRWLGYDWGDNLFFASDYFERMYEFAQHLIREGKAYVDSLNEEEIREYRGTVTAAGRESPYRSRSVEENLDLFARMRAGEFPDGAHVLRAKIDMAASNMLLRDPILYRIRHAHHYRTGDAWCIYPLYDFAHPIEDALECVTHSICTLEFENNRPLYDWVVTSIPVSCRPRQYEFARRVLDYTVMSKRKLLDLVRSGLVAGWDDPRMPTIAGLRRRGVTAAAIRNFCEMVGVARTASRTDIGKLEYAIRDDLNQTAPRVLCVLNPLRVVITNYPQDESEELDAPYFPHDVPREGSRKLPFSRVVYIDRDDFMEDPPKGFFRLSPGSEVRLRYAYIIRCDEVVKDDSGKIVELRCSYDPRTRGGTTPDGRTVRGTIQWVSAQHGLSCEVRLYDRLFTVADPEDTDGDFKEFLNPDSLVVTTGAVIEPSVRDDPAGSRYQFERLGYFCSDPVESTPERLIFNRTVTLRDTWARATRKEESPPRKSAPRREVPEGRVDRAGSVGEAVVAATDPAGTGLPEFVGATPNRVRVPELEPVAIRLEQELGLPVEDAEILTRDVETAALFEAALQGGASARGVANWMIHELFRAGRGSDVASLPFGGRELGELVAMVENGTLSSTGGREVLDQMMASGGSPAEIVDRLGLRQVSDAAALQPLVDEVIGASAAKVEEYRAGKVGLLGFFVGQVMRRSGGKANPEVVRSLLEEGLQR